MLEYCCVLSLIKHVVVGWPSVKEGCDAAEGKGLLSASAAEL